MDQDVRRQAREAADPAVRRYVEDVGRRVARPTESTRAVPERLVVLDAPDPVNVFPVPGGTIDVYSGLLLAARDEAELAGVLAHEVGHVAERHVAQRLVADSGLRALAAAALGENPSIAAQLASSLAAGGALLRYSRDQEREADRDAVYALARAGHGADGLADFFRRLSAAQGSPGVLQFLRSHPAPGERAVEVDRLATRVGAHRGERAPERLQAMVSSLKRSYAGRPLPPVI